mmetsp:Transcript_45830/g.96193  ORF Transcript_45830/g.96193 Transcript_45830/m.96193 type:complete len:250 (+) Transcript_45830:116-865(+)
MHMKALCTIFHRSNQKVHLISILGHNHEIIHLQNHAYSLRCQLDGARCYQQGLNHILVVHVGNASLLHINTSPYGSLCVFLPQLSHNLNGLQSRVFRQSVGDNLQCVRIGLETMRVHSRRLQRQLTQSKRRLRLSGSTTCNQKPLLHQRPDDALGIVNGSIGLRQDQLVRSTKEHRRCTSGIGHADEFDDLVSRTGEDDVSHMFSAAQLFRREGVNVRNGRASQGAADELNVGAFNIRDNEDAHLGQEV